MLTFVGTIQKFHRQDLVISAPGLINYHCLNCMVLIALEAAVCATNELPDAGPGDALKATLTSLGGGVNAFSASYHVVKVWKTMKVCLTA